MNFFKSASYAQKTETFKALTKFSLSLMNSSVAVYGYMITAPVVNSTVLASMFGGNMLMAMSSQVMGQIVEVEEDKKMLRTRNRPLPSNLMSILKAKRINVGLWGLANGLMYFGNVAPLAILISNATYASYFLYLKMKPLTKLNTFFGAIVGSLPLLIGMTHNISPMDLGIQEICDLGYLFFWQFLHFYGIVVIYKEDYGKTNFKMESDDNKLFFLFMASAIAMAAISYIKINQGAKSGFTSICKGLFVLSHAIFISYIFAFWKNPTPQAGKTIKHFSYILFFAYFILSHLIINHSKIKEMNLLREKHRLNLAESKISENSKNI